MSAQEAAEGAATAPATTDTGESVAGAQEGSEAAQTGAERASREAARYRTRLREAEAQLEQRDGAISAMRSEVDRLHRAEVERLAGTAPFLVRNPADVWLVSSLGDMRDADGRLDETKVAAVLRDVLRERPQWREGHGGPGMDGGARGGGRPIGTEPSFAGLFKGQRRA